MPGNFFALGSCGLAIGELHQRLLENGYDLEAGEARDQRFGLTTDVAIKNFQASHVDANGKRLEPDGIVGPRTLWALSHPSGPQDKFYAEGWKCDPSAAIKRVVPCIEAAVADIGLREGDSPNDGPQIEKFFLDESQRGQPWCAFAASYWVRKCDGGTTLDRPIASAYKWQQHGVKHSQVFEPSKAQAGDVFVILRGDLHGHVGIIVNTNDDGSLSTVEGNVGNAVRGCVRRYQAFTCIVRAWYR